MSGVYIKGMEMPTDDMKNIMILADGRVFQFSGYGNPKPLGTAILVPDHGRCVDADAILNNNGVGTQIAGWGKMYHETVIEYAPTIIPADKEGDNG